MSDTLGPLMQKNLLEVFGQRDSALEPTAKKHNHSGSDNLIQDDDDHPRHIRSRTLAELVPNSDKGADRYDVFPKISCDGRGSPAFSFLS